MRSALAGDLQQKGGGKDARLGRNRTGGHGTDDRRCARGVQSVQPSVWRLLAVSLSLSNPSDLPMATGPSTPQMGYGSRPWSRLTWARGPGTRTVVVDCERISR